VPELDLAQVDTASSVLGKGADGKSVAQGMIDQIDSSNVGGQIVDRIGFQLSASANVEKLKASGASMGGNWGSGFLSTVKESVPSELVRILSDLVTPNVLANLRLQDGLEGAAP